MYGRSFVKKAVSAAALCPVLIALFLCSKDSDKGTNPPVYADPAISLAQPAGADTVLPETAASFRITGSVTVAEGLSILSFTINNVDYTDSVSASKKQFSVTLTVAVDTNVFILKLTDTKNKSALDTVRIVRLKSAIPATKSVLTGTMYRPGTGPRARRLASPAIASDAGGRSKEVYSTIPLSGADILLYKADSLATASFASTKTDTAGRWKVTVDPGNYFIFAVWFDQMNLELITASIQNVRAEAGKADTTEEKIALADDVPPMVLTFLDAQTSDDKNNFLASNLPQGFPIIITFSEPMNRISVGDDTTGIVLGEIDPTDATLTLKSKIPLEKAWSATGKELRLIPKAALTVGRYYKVLIPSAVKDLALNKLGSTCNGIFSAIALADAVPFAVKGATVQNGDTISAAKVVEIAFSRPIDGISLNKQYTLTPALNSFFETKGTIARLSFPIDSGLAPSTGYTLKISRSMKDLLGDSLPADYALSFRTGAGLDPSATQGTKGKIVGFVSGTMEAFIAQDIERFGQSFHPLLEAVDIMTDQQGKEQSVKQSYEAFLLARRNDAALRKRMAIEGVLFPKIYFKLMGADTVAFRKLTGKPNVGTAPAGVALFIEDVGPGGFKQPRVLDGNGVNISTQVAFKGDTIVAFNYAFIVNIPFTMAFFSNDNDQRDPYYFGKLQNEKTNIEMHNVTIVTRDTYTIRSIDTAKWTAAPSSADVFFDLVTTELMSNSSKTMARAMAIKMTMVNENGRLLVRTIVSKGLFEGTKDQFAANQNTILNSQNFNPDSFKVEGTRAIELFSPAQKAVKVGVPVQFKWSKVAGVNSYLLGISNEMSGGASGLLVFTKDTGITIGASGEVTGGTVLTIDPSQIKVPLPRFTSRICGFDTAGVYGWKVVGFADTTSNKLAGQPMIIADSDFRPAHQWGCFTLAAVMPDLSKFNNQPVGPGPGPAPGNDFADADKDGFPDWIEKALGTNCFDAGSRPEMQIDSDKDGIADFFEIALAAKPDDPAVKPADANGNHIPDALESKPTWDPRLAKDTDNDSWPDEIEMMLKTDPWNAGSKPEALAKGAAPVGNYRGKLLLQADNKEFSLAISIYADSTGMSTAVIDSTGLDILRAGENVSLKFISGEWVFYYKMVAGMNVNKYLKFRCVPKYQELEGNIDMSDQADGGGPLVGRFRVRTDGNVGSLLGGGTNPGPGPQPGVINEPPQDFAKTLASPPPDAKAMSIAISKDAAGKFTATLTLAGSPPVSSIEATWQPQMFPMYIFRFKGDSGEIRVEGAIFKDAAGLYLGGPVFVNMKQPYNFALKNGSAKVDDPTSGTWNGYAMKSNFTGPNPNDQGLLAYIGPREALVSALNQTKNKGMRTFDSVVVDIKEFWQEGIWKCKDSTGKVYQILEKPGDPQNVFVGKDKSGNDVVMIRPDGQQPNNQQSGPFTGPIDEIKNALAASGNLVKVTVPNNPVPNDAQVDIATLQQTPDPKTPSKMIYQINDKNNPAKRYMFMADPQNGKLAIMDGKPLVSEIGGQQQPQGKHVPFTGAISDIQNALNGSGNMVKVMAPNNPAPQDAQVNPGSLQPFTDPQKPGVTMYQIKDNANPMKMYLFMADSATKQLLLMDKKPLVSEMGGGQPGQIPPIYRGSLQNVEAALTASTDGVLLINPQNGSKTPINVNRSTLQPVPDPKAQGQTMTVASRTDDPMKKVVFLGDPMDPAKLNVDPGSKRPVVADGPRAKR